METNLKEKQMLLNTRQANVFHLEAIIFLISPIHIHRLIYAHSLCFTPSSSDKRGAMMELSWLRCSRVSLPPLPRSSSSQHWKLRDRFWVIIPKIHAVYGQVMLFLPTVHSSSLPFLFWFRLPFFHFLRLREVTLIVSLI